MRFVASGVIVAALLLAAQPARAWNPLRTRHGDVEEGSELLRAGKPGEALKAFEAAREDIPERAELHYDVGLAQYALGEYAQAVKAFERALERVEGPFKAPVLYALGTAYASWALQAEGSPEDAELALDRWKQALHYLERTLRREPTHAGALRNLELALLRVDPPCGARDTEYEPNDEAAGAVPLPFPEGSHELDIPLKLCEEDEDWFVVPLQPGDRLSAEVSTETPEAEIALELTGAQGEERLRPPAGSDNTVTALDYQAGGSAGELRLRVRNVAEEEADYRLKVRLLPSCASLEDGFEDNDGPGAARAVTEADAEKLGQLRLCPRDDDWFAAEIAEGHSLVVVANFETEHGTPSLAITDPSGRVLAERTAAPAAEGEEGDGKAPLMLTLLEPPAGRYLVRVSGTLDVEAGYGLQMMALPPCPDGDDGQEDNDTAADAKPFEAGKPQLLRVCPGDEDWFAFTGKPDERLVVSAAFDHERGDLDLELYREGAETPEAESRQSSPTAGGEAVALPEVEEETTFHLRVAGVDDAQNFYLLNAQAPSGDGQQNQDQQQDQQKQDQQQDQEKKDEQKQDQQKQDQQKQDQQKQDQQQQDQQQQDQQQQDQQQQDQRKQEEQKRDAMEDVMDDLDRNPRNVEAERARQRSQYRRARPTKPW